MDGITDIQILALIICAVLSYVAYKTKTPSVSIIPAIGFFIVGFEIFNTSGSLLLLGLFFTVAVVQFVISFSHAGGR